jgi:hypothetical protein
MDMGINSRATQTLEEIVLRTMRSASPVYMPVFPAQNMDEN